MSKNHDVRRIVSLNGTWKLGQGAEPSRWIPACVPGNVQEDLWHAGLKPDPYVGMNADSYRELEGSSWVYSRTFDLDSMDRHADWTLLFEGIDYQADFFLNGTALGRHQGAYGEAAFDVTGLLRPEGNECAC